MPVLFNTSTGLAENLPDNDAAHAALAAGSHEVPLISPEGDTVSSAHPDAQALISQGYRQPTPHELTGLLNTAKYSTPGQQALGMAEQVGRGALGPIPSMIERGLGVPAEDIQGREENMSTLQKVVGQGAGLLIPGLQGKALAKVGELGAAALGIGEGANILTKTGSAAAKAAIENAVYQSGDEITKATLGDPGQSIGSAAANIGLSAVLGAGIGGAIGAVPPIWEATLGPRADMFLRSIKDRADGITVPMSQDLNTVITNMEKAGKDVPAAIKAGLSDNELAHNYFQELRESGTTTGDALRGTIEQFKLDTGDVLKNVFQEGGAMTSFEAGEKAKDLIRAKADELHDAISARYAKIMPAMEAIQIPLETRVGYAQELAKAGEGFGSKGSPAEALFKSYADRVAVQDSVVNLKRLNTEVGSEMSMARRAGDFEKARALSDIRDSIKGFQNRQIESVGKHFESQGIEGAQQFTKWFNEERAATDKAYSAFIDKIGDVASAGRLGKVKSHGQLMEALENVPSAKFADKLFDPKNVEALRFLQKEFPGVMENLIQAKKTSMIEAATTKGDLMHNQLLNNVNKLPKEVREIMFSPEETNTINAAGRILRESGKRANPSGTGTAMDKIMSQLPAGVGGMASMILGHNPLVGYMMGHAAKFVTRDAPDAMKMSLLKFLGSSEAVDSSAWKVANDYLHAAMRGDNKLKLATKAVFKAGQEVFPKTQMPDQQSRDKLDRRLLKLRNDPTPMLQMGGKLGHYMPDHAEALGSFAANAVNVLNSMRPTSIQLSPLDKPFQNPMQKAHYDRALDIAEQPAILMQRIKDGSLLQSDVDVLKAVNPAVYKSMSQKLMTAMTEHISGGGEIPYEQRLGISRFLGMPLDSTMTQQGMQSIIQSASPPPQQQAQGPRARKPSDSTQNRMSKLAGTFQTPTQAAESRRTTRT